MALQIADRVRETTTTSGTGTVNLAGATAGFQTFVAGIGTGNTCHYLLLDGTAWETGVGTVTDGSPDTLTRDTVIASSNAGAKIVLSGGETAVLCTLPGSASQIRAAIGITDNGIIDWTSTSSNLNTSGSVTSGALTANGNVTLGDASADTLTINAGTWTLGSKYTATRAVGVAPAGFSFFGTWATSFSGDAGGTTNGRAIFYTTDVQGSNNVSMAVGLQQNIENQMTSGTLGTAVSNLMTASATTAATTTLMECQSAEMTISGSGNVTTGIHYIANSPALTSTGAFTTLIGFRANNIGHGSLVTNAIGFDALNMTVSPTLTVSYRSQQNSGTGAWGFLHTGTANNAFAGNVRIGSSVAPTVALDVTGSAIVSGNGTFSGRVGVGAGGFTGVKMFIGGNSTGATSTYGFDADETIQSDVTTAYNAYLSFPGTQAAVFTLTELNHFQAGQDTFGAGSVVTNQYGFRVAASLTGAANNYGFYSNIASGAGRWNFYAAGTANNALNGATRFGSTTAPINTVDITGSFGRGEPVTKTGDFTLAATENWVINNKSGSACVVTLPAASSWTGREVMIKNIQAQTVDSASSNVVPLAGGAAGTAILSANAGRWCTLVSDGSSWVIMQGVV